MSGCLCSRLPGCCGTHGPRPLFRNANAWSGVGGAVPPFDLPTRPSGDNNRPAPSLDVCQRINGKNGTTRHAAATHSFDDTPTSNARLLFDRSQSQLADDPAFPPRVNALGASRARTALCVNFRQGFTALHACHGTTARTHPDPDTPPAHSVNRNYRAPINRPNMPT